MALALRLGAVAAFTTMFMLVKSAGEQGLALPEVMFWRQFVPVILIVAWLGAKNGLARLRTRRIRAHAARSLVGMTGMIGNFGAAMLLPLAVSTTLGFTAPLFAVVLGSLVMGETVGAWRWSAVLLGFAGVLIIAQPGIEPISPLGAAAGLMAALVVALVSYQVRDLGRTDEPISVVFYFALFGSLLTAPLLPFYMTPHDGWNWLVLAAVGVSGTVGQLFLVGSLRYGSVASVIVMDYTSLIWATLYGWAIWGDLPPATTWLGAPLVIGAGLLVSWREHKLHRKPSPASPVEID